MTGELPVSHALVAALPDDGAAPEWITLFPKTGTVSTRDGRSFEVDPAALIAAFDADGLAVPVDVNHATDTAAMAGGRSDAVGWVRELRVRGGALEARVEWLAEGRELLAAKKYLYVSPSFWADKSGSVTRLKAVALVTSPALAQQPALANAGVPGLRQIAAALGLGEAATPADCLAVIDGLRAADMAALRDRALATLAATRQKLDALTAATRKAKVDGLIHEALTAKKIVPAQKDVFFAMCETDQGLDQFERLMAVTMPMLQPSGLDGRRPPGGDDDEVVQLVARARAKQDEAAARGQTLTTAEAVMMVSGGL